MRPIEDGSRAESGLPAGKAGADLLISGAKSTSPKGAPTVAMEVMAEASFCAVIAIIGLCFI